MRIVLLTAMLLIASIAHAQDREVPYWASIKAETLNMRAGPGRDFPIRWVYRRAGLPLKVNRVHEGWRLVRDPDGAEGWVTANLLSKERGVIVIGKDLADIRAEPVGTAKLRWKAEPGVVAALSGCEAGWCKVDVQGRAGYIRADRLWGSGEP